MSTKAPLLSINGVTRQNLGARFLHEVSFSLYGGEIMGLTGESGAGKSALLETLSGVVRPDAGEVRVEGFSIPFGRPAVPGIAMVPQYSHAIDGIDVAGNILLGHESCRGPFLDRRAILSRAEEVLNRMKAGFSTKAKMRKLSLSQRRALDIGRAFSMDPKIILLDEPALHLTSVQRKAFFDILREQRVRGAGILYVSRDAEEIRPFCDRIAVLRDGVLVGVWRADEIAIDAMRGRTEGRKASRAFPAGKTHGKESVLSVDELSLGNAVKNVSFELRCGEVLGLWDRRGTGGTGVAEALMGLRRVDAGTFEVMGRRVRIGNPAQAKALGLAYLPEDRREGLALRHGIVQNVTLASLGDYCPGILIDRDKEYIKAESYAEKYGVRAASLYASLEFLSGGDQQKILFARALDTSPHVLILNEPTRGIDSETRCEVYRIVRETAAAGCAILFVSSDLDELLGVSHRIAVMRGAELAGILGSGALDRGKAMELAADDEPEEAVDLETENSDDGTT